MNTDAIKELLYKIADDQLIIGHRNSEWTGMGPILEEDIAFSSMAQDKIGQSYALYQLLHDLGEDEPDQVAFMRKANQFKNSQLTELPNGEYDYSLLRHFLFDTAESIRFEFLAQSAYSPLALLAKKIQGELRYHTMHANTWIKQLGNANQESILRLQASLDQLFPFALGIFEPSPFENVLIEEKIFVGEKVIMQKWQEQIAKILNATELLIPSFSEPAIYGGRFGHHTEHLTLLLEEMSEVFRIDPTAEW
ncbi:1,2-phenylacetyl-CoA epoxidase subunit PaaC [Fulvivirga sediminis]|uniref:Phenylacetate-CoA oxygenase subunit PaaC n=1 Tax=Fulvivirga sediminis TaxID=2803949 RepID=A0A937K0J7_9BACT|nr:1,2-phenylacetyl-CoA epoxidase subunit PaaC [Fulvivirga sediminis]MBL3655647.1 phenylacetate-CoA oxygenase subunit PaaC [Fulvivirga sediminis]